MPYPLKDTNLFKPLKVGNVTLKNRTVFAPTTRFRNTEDFVATDSMLEYYAERAENNGGLLILEGVFGAPEFGLYENAPMIYTDRQVAAFKKLVAAIHEKGSYAALQLWNLGRQADPAVLKKHGLDFVAPSAIYINDDDKKKAEAAGNPLRALTVDEIHEMVKTSAEAAKRSIEGADFDIVEIHGAHMYLVDQFLNESSNQRTDEYGGSIENRARFLLEVVDALVEAVGPEHVGIRLSPYAVFAGGLGINSRINPIATWGYVLSELERRGKEGSRLAYVHIVEPRVSGNADNPVFPDIDTNWIETIWTGVVIRAGALLHDTQYKELRRIVDANDRTLIGASRYYTSNPDLAVRLKNGYELTPYDRSTFYNKFSNWGYITWGKYGEANATQDSEIAQKVPKALA